MSVIYPSRAPPLSVDCAYLHGHGVFNEHRSQLSVELKEDLSLTGLVQVTQRQRLDVEGLPSLQLHLGLKKMKDEWGRGGDIRLGLKF